MRRLPTSEFSLRLLASPRSEDDMPQSEVVSNGSPTGKVIDGAVLELAVSWRDLALAFVTDNFMHEETLRIYLFDDNFEVIDCAWLGSMYATGVFSLIELQPPNTVRFLFFGDTDWTLELLEEENFALPFVEPRGVH
ncbi:MAG TPA: hypothetical protein VN089_26790, partial [Duganella sp.]|nr:hypothetical protein [Duganella sp.]